jgi:hypothetical protein
MERFEREVNSPYTPREEISDRFQVWLGADEHLCELKAPCISQAAGAPRNLQFYFRDDHVGLIKECGNSKSFLL